MKKKILDKKDGKDLADMLKRDVKIKKDGKMVLEGVKDTVQVGKIKEFVDPKHLKILKDPKLLEIIDKEFNKFIVDEKETRKSVFICGCGAFVKNLTSTFNVFISGESSAGKSWVVKNVLKIFPEEIFSKETYRTKITANAFTYWHNSKVEPEWTWNGKILYLEDVGNDILNSNVFKVMVSEGSTATIVGRKKGKGFELPATFDIEIIGKPIVFITTAAGTPIEEIKNRFVMFSLDESEEQTKKIMEMQTKWAIDGKLENYNEEIRESLNYLKRVNIILPAWIKKMTKYIPRKELVRWRREFPRFLEIIKCSAALHQFQREEKNGDIVANEKDYEIARQIIGKITASSGAEGLTRRDKFGYEIIKQFYKKKKRGCTRIQIYAFKPIYSDRGWEKILDRLSQKGLLNIRLEENPDTNRKAAFFYPIEFENLSLPEFVLLNEQKEPMELDLGITHKSQEPGKKAKNNDILPKKNLKAEPNLKGTLTNSISTSYSISAISSVSLMIMKNGEPFNLTLEAGQKYKESDFGDEPEKTLKILADDGKIKWL